jgi:hypothetical protein
MNPTGEGLSLTHKVQSGALGFARKLLTPGD